MLVPTQARALRQLDEQSHRQVDSVSWQKGQRQAKENEKEKEKEAEAQRQEKDKKRKKEKEAEAQRQEKGKDVQGSRASERSIGNAWRICYSKHQILLQGWGSGGGGAVLASFTSSGTPAGCVGTSLVKLVVVLVLLLLRGVLAAVGGAASRREAGVRQG